MKKFNKIKVTVLVSDYKITRFVSNKLSLMEKKEGFQEAIISSKTKKKIRFFNLGEKNDWNKLLDKKIIRKIESNFKNEMSELGYL